jgi:transcriptional regulator with XRE-family HTH domain
VEKKMVGNAADLSVMCETMPPRRQPADKPVHPLRQWRDRWGLSQTQLAAMASTTQGMIGHIERYIRTPRPRLMERLVDCTGLPIEAFVLPERFVRESPNFLRRSRRPRKDRTGEAPHD